MQVCGKYISAAVNQHATIEEAVFSVGPLRDYMTWLTTFSSANAVQFRPQLWSDNQWATEVKARYQEMSSENTAEE
jgi:hypothetical protein